MIHRISNVELRGEKEKSEEREFPPITVTPLRPVTPVSEASMETDIDFLRMESGWAMRWASRIKKEYEFRKKREMNDNIVEMKEKAGFCKFCGSTTWCWVPFYNSYVCFVCPPKKYIPKQKKKKPDKEKEDDWGQKPDSKKERR